MNRVINIGVLLLLVLFISFRVNVACNELRSDKTGNISIQPELPKTFIGFIPCNSCPDIQYTLILESERYVEISDSITGKTAPVHIEGHWKLKSDTLFIFDENTLPRKHFLWKEDEIFLLNQDNTKVSKLTINIGLD